MLARSAQTLLARLIQVAAILFRLLSSVLVALIVMLLALLYLNTAGERRDAVARALLYALGERSVESGLAAPQDWRTLSVGQVRLDTPRVAHRRLRQARQRQTVA